MVLLKQYTYNVCHHFWPVNTMTLFHVLLIVAFLMSGRAEFF